MAATPHTNGMIDTNILIDAMHGIPNAVIKGHASLSHDSTVNDSSTLLTQVGGNSDSLLRKEKLFDKKHFLCYN